MQTGEIQDFVSFKNRFTVTVFQRKRPFFIYFRDFEIDRNRWKTTATLEDLQTPEMKEWSNKWNNYINEIRPKNYHRRVGTKVGISHGSIHEILSDDLKMKCVSEKLFRCSWTRIKWKLGSWLNWMFWKKHRGSSISRFNCYSWQNLSVCLRGGDRYAVIIMVHNILSLCKLITPSQIQSKSNAHSVFRYRRCGASWIFTSYTNSYRPFIRGSFEKTEGGNPKKTSRHMTKRMAHHDNDPSYTQFVMQS